MEKIENNFSYLQGEFNACSAVGEACVEASTALSKKFKNEPGYSHFILIEISGIMTRASMIIKKQNDKLGVEGMYRPDK